jgi:hypothetical protein
VLGLGGAGTAGHHRVHELEVARVRVEADLDLVAVAGFEQALRAVVVLDVARARVGNRGDRLHLVERLRALEFGEDRLDRAIEVVREDAEPAAVGHPQHDLFGAVLPRQGGDLVDHRHGDVEALDREHLLAQVRLLQEALELVDVDQPREQCPLLLVAERRAVPAGLDHLPQPHPLLMRGEVLDLVRDRAAVRLTHPGQRLQQGLPLDAAAQDRGGDPRHQLGRQVQVLGLERRIPLGRAAERVDTGGEVSVRAVGLEQRGRSLHRLQQLPIGLRGDGRRRCGGGGCAERRRGGRRRVGGADHAGRNPELLGHVLVEAVLALQ